MRDSVFFIGQDQEFEAISTKSRGASEDSSENLTLSEQISGITYYRPFSLKNGSATKPP